MAVDITTWGTGSHAQLVGMDKWYRRARFDILPPVVPASGLTIEYFQRVWDIDNSQWCYYTQTAINASPGTSDTQPTNSGNIISSSVVQILEIY
tara:strand:- start:225 stop:506 length:282 start_codon:yes stop_codon:yes gene_type:complete